MKCKDLIDLPTKGIYHGKLYINKKKNSIFKDIINKGKPNKNYNYSIFKFHNRSFQNDIKKITKDKIYFNQHFHIKNITSGSIFGYKNL